MGTSNFAYDNTDRCYVVMTDEFFEVADFREEAYAVAKDVVTFSANIQRTDGWNPEGMHSYPSQFLLYVDISDRIFDVDISISSRLILTSGYYEHACLDFATPLFNLYSSNDYTEADEVCLSEYFVMGTDKQTEYRRPFVERRMEGMRDRLVSFMNEVCAKLCPDTQYRTVGRFSNGETVMEKCETQ
jgi:hypothetical protein